MDANRQTPKSRREAGKLYDVYYDSIFIKPSAKEIKLAEMPFDERVNYTRAKGERAAQLFPDSLRELKGQLIDTDPLVLLSTLVLHGLSYAGANQEWERDEPLLKHHIELLQAFVLQHGRAEFAVDGGDVRTAASCEPVAAAIKALEQLYLTSADADLDPVLPESERAARRMSKAMQVQTQVVRNWGTMPQVLRITAGLFAPVEERLQKQAGVRIGDLLAMFQNILSLVERREQKHADGLNSVHAAATFRAAEEEFGRHFPGALNGVDEYRRHAEHASVGLDGFKRLLTMKACSEAPAVYTFTLGDFVTAYPASVDAAALRRVLDELWSLSFGELAGVGVDDLFLGNPIWERPLIRLGADTYFFPALWVSVGFCVELMEKVVGTVPKLFSKYEDVYKGRFLEEETERLIRKALPAAQVSCGSKGEIKTHGEALENDLTAVVGSCALVVEAKAHKVTARGRKGYHDRLKTKVGELLVNPSKQGLRFVGYLKRHPGVTTFPSKRGGKNQIDSSGIREYVRLNVTLESLGSLATHTPSLRSAGLIDVDHDIAPTLALSDLETILEVLEGTCEKFHYFMRRAQVDREENYAADELDLLYSYLRMGLNFKYQRLWHGVSPGDGEAFWLLSRNSRHLNPYLLRHISKQPVPKPRRELTKWWRQILSQVERERPPRWVEAGCVLLNATVEDQLGIEGELARMRKEVARARRPRNMFKLRQTIYRHVGGGETPDVLVVFAYGVMPRDLFDRLVRNTRQLALDQTRSSRAVVLGVDVSQQSSPYSFIEYVEKGG